MAGGDNKIGLEGRTDFQSLFTIMFLENNANCAATKVNVFILDPSAKEVRARVWQ